jgi:hypothetical protein
MLYGEEGNPQATSARSLLMAHPFLADAMAEPLCLWQSPTRTAAQEREPPFSPLPR